MLAWLSAVLLAAPALAAAPRCFEPQVLGTWRLQLSRFDLRPAPDTDRVTCPSTLKPADTLLVRLEQGGVLIDLATGASGSWSMGGTQALEARLLGLNYLFDFAYEENATHTISHCWRSAPGRGWASEDRVRPEAIACVSAELIEAESPVIETVFPKDGDSWRAELGPSAQPPVGVGVDSPDLIGSLETLELNFSWTDVSGTSFLPSNPQSQGSCNSSFAISALKAMMSRIMIATNKTSPIGVTQFFSLQHVLDCNVYSQGCAGGLPEHVLRFARERGVLVEDDYYLSYVSFGDGEAHACQLEKGPGHSGSRRYYFTAGQPLGGHYGTIFDPVEIQREVRNHGPIPVGIHSIDEYYNDAFTGEKLNTNDEVVEVDHYVLLVGWVTKDGVGYWLVQDPQDTTDTLREIEMGLNKYGIESAPTTLYWVREAPKNPPRRLTIRKIYVLLLFIGSLILAALALALLIAILVVRFRRPKFRPIVA